MYAVNHECAGAWAARAPALADWAWERLVNRCNCWGAYRAELDIGKEYKRQDGATGKLGEQLTVKGTLSRAVLIRHFQGHNRSDIVGLHVAGPDNLSKGGALDIDHHGPQSTAADINWKAAYWWGRELTRLGFHPLLLDSNGRGGFHVRLLLSSPIPADRLYHFLKKLVSNHKDLGFGNPPEQFPKQPDVRRCRKGLGNWLRLPGRHHKRPFWSRVWNGERWLQGHAAIDFILALTGDSPDLIPSIPAAPSVPAPQQSPRNFRITSGSNLTARINGRLRRLPNLCEGQGRDDVAFGFAAWLVRDMGLSDEVALGWLEIWDAGNRPPKGRDRLAEIVRNARDYGQHEIGCALATRSNGVFPTSRPGHYVLRCTVEI